MTAGDLVIDRGSAAGREHGELVRWDGKPETVERLRDLMPGGVTLIGGVLQVKVLRKISPRRAVHGDRVVPVGWYVTLRTCKHGETYAVIKPPETVNA